MADDPEIAALEREIKCLKEHCDQQDERLRALESGQKALANLSVGARAIFWFLGVAGAAGLFFLNVWDRAR